MLHSSRSAILSEVSRLCVASVFTGLLGIAVLVMPLVVASAQDPSATDETGDKPGLRLHWFYDQRAYPEETIPDGAHFRARKQLQKVLQAETLSVAPPLPGNRWEQIGPAPSGPKHYAGPTSGRVKSIAAVSASLYYLGAASGGVWKTANGGSSWAPLTDGQASLAMGSIAIDPSNPSIIYAGTGEYWVSEYAGYYGAGLLKSTDAGASWTHIPGPWDTSQGGRQISKVVVIAGPTASDPEDDIVLVAGRNGLFRSDRGGVNFTDTSAAVLGGDISDVVVDPGNTGILYAARHSVGVYRSTDGGLNWDANTGTTAIDPIWAPGVTGSGCVILRGSLALAPTNTNILYAAFQTNNNCADGSGNLFKTNNARAGTPVFNQLPAPTTWCQGQCGYDLAVIAQPYDPDGAGPLQAENIVYIGGVEFHRSTDGGATWTILGRDPVSVHADLHAFAFDPSGALLVGCDGGIYRHPSPATALSADPGWVELNTNLAITQFYPGVSVHPSSVQPGATLVLGGTQDNGSQRYQGQLEWDWLKGGDGGYTAIDFSNTDTWYISAQGLDIVKTTNNGVNFNAANNGLPNKNTFYIAAPYIMCPDNAQVLVVVDDFGLWRTDNGAASWFDNSPDLVDPATEHWHDSPRALAFAPGTGCNTYFAAGTSVLGRVFRTTTGGGTGASNWEAIGSGLPNRAPTDLAAHPSSNNILYITFSGFCGNNDTCPAGQGHVWVTNNALEATAANVSWTDITGGKGLPNIPVNAIVVDASDTSILYIGTDLGVYRSFNQGQSWELFNDGLPNVAVTDLVMNNETQVLVAATYGRSVYMLSGEKVYVDGSWNGCELGTWQCPYNTLAEGINAISNGGQLWIKAGTYSSIALPLNVSKPMTLKSYEGSAIIGVQQ